MRAYENTVSKQEKAGEVELTVISEPLALSTMRDRKRSAENLELNLSDPIFGSCNVTNENDEQTSLRRQLAIHKRNLNHLKEQLAKYGQMDAPPYLLNRIADEEVEIQHLEKQLNEESGGLNG